MGQLTHSFQVTDDCIGFKTILVNLYVIQIEGRVIMVDAGVSLSASTLRAWFRNKFQKETPDAVILTHAHFDHIGAISSFLQHGEFPIYLHENERTYAEGNPYLPPDPTVGGGALALSSILYPRKCESFAAHVRVLSGEEGAIDLLPGWTWFSTPGHTPGHISLFRELDRLLLAGDALTTVKQESLVAVWKQEQILHGPPQYYTPDWIAAEESARWIVSKRPTHLATGHGVPMKGDMLPHQLDQYVDEFKRLAVPKKGRYVHTQDTNSIKGTSSP